MTFLQGHTDQNHENMKCLIISETIQAMPVKFAVKIVWLKVYMTIARLMTLSFIQGHKCISYLALFNLQYLRQYLRYYIQTGHDSRHRCRICSFWCSWPWCKVTAGRQRQQISVELSPQKKQATSIKLAMTVGHFLHDLDLDFAHIYMAWPFYFFLGCVPVCLFFYLGCVPDDHSR